MAYTNTFIYVPDTCDITKSKTPISTKQPPTIHYIQYQLLTNKPYYYNHLQLVWEVYKRRMGLNLPESREEIQHLKSNYLAKGHPCMRASSLTKTHGFGAHYNSEGKIALYGIETKDYEELLKNSAVDKIMAMRVKRK